MTFDPFVCDPQVEDLTYNPFEDDDSNADRFGGYADASQDDGEPVYFDLSDDADALASAGWGTDEDYGGAADW